MNAVQTLIRRTAAALGAIAALTVPGLATAQSVQLKSGGVVTSECPYSTMSVSPSGTVVVTCTGASSAGNFALTAPTSLTTNTANTAALVKVTRSGGTAGASDVAFTVAGASCNPVTPSPLQFADGIAGSQSIEISTGATSGDCVVTMISASVGMRSSPYARTIKVSNPDDNVAFAFSSPSSTTTVGGGAVTITVTRTGGINGTWNVPYVLAGTLAGTADDNVTANGELSGALVFTGAVGSVPGNQTASLTYTPPSSPVPQPSNLVISFGAPTGGIGAPQVATIGAPHELTLNSAPVGCPVPETVANSMLGAYANGTTLRMASGTISTYVLPAPTLGKSTGTFRISAGTSTYPMAPYYFEVHINKCKGLVEATPGDTCYGKYSTKTGVWSKNWFIKTIAGNLYFDTEAKIKAAGYCYAPPADGPWYVNIRYTYPACEIGGNCGWNYQWYNWGY